MKNIIRYIRNGHPIATTFLAELKLTEDNKLSKVENKDKIIQCNALMIQELLFLSFLKK